jgi:hypothetical protein
VAPTAIRSKRSWCRRRRCGQRNRHGALGHVTAFGQTTQQATRHQRNRDPARAHADVPICVQGSVPRWRPTARTPIGESCHAGIGRAEHCRGVFGELACDRGSDAFEHHDVVDFAVEVSGMAHSPRLGTTPYRFAAAKCGSSPASQLKV